MTALYQIIKPNDLKPIVKAYYELKSPISVKLIRAGFNHNYRLNTGDRLLILRVYLNNKYYIRSPDDFRFELELLDYLNKQGIPVANPLKNHQNEYLSWGNFENKTRYFALFNYAVGTELNFRLKPDIIYQLGETIAKLHQATACFYCHYFRYSLDLNNILIEPIQILEKYLFEHNKNNLYFFQPTYRELLNRVESLTKTTENFGLIHGDLNESNIHFDKEAGFTIFDFDHCGYGWRAYDLTPFWDMGDR